MNKTVLFVTFACLAALGIIGGLVLMIHRPDATATFTNLLVLILGLVVSAAGTFYALGKTNDKLDTVVRQTNGQLSSKEDEISRLRQKLADNGITPEDPEVSP